ncbi:putative LRR receptor-like serine/threonine-protein kinase MRH1 [Hordeum vulgare]|nr:putative LRR receptor-like serine/threonine-protein kinase MRH1 [Hordeum vulgare]
MERLPEELLVHVVSLTSPPDACRAAAVSRAFRATADSDAVWSFFLPRNLPRFAKGELPCKPTSKKGLFRRLSDHPALLPHKLVSMQLDRATGAERFTISARALQIPRCNGSHQALLTYELWIATRSRFFSEAAQFCRVNELDIRAKIQRKMLSQNTTYVVCLVFKLAYVYSGSDFTHEVASEVHFPREKADGWMEVELGEFHNEEDDDGGEVSISFTGESKSGLIVLGIELRSGAAFLVMTTAFAVYCRAKKVGTVRPWVTGLSGQLQRAFVTGVPSLKRSELEAASEDFSNIIGSTANCMLYKGTLSSGVEIAVVSSLISSMNDWSKACESYLSKVGHKNFINLLGYCEEENPFTRAMVFEYAPNGTLFEHLHDTTSTIAVFDNAFDYVALREAENLDWMARLRISMGIAYCLEQMHKLNPPVVTWSFNSTTIYLTDDFASKVSNLDFWNGTKGSDSVTDDCTMLDIESIVHQYGTGCILPNKRQQNCR